MLNSVYVIAPSFSTNLPNKESKIQFFINSQSDLRVQQLKRVIAMDVGLISPDEELWSTTLD
jgi:hypothetical protein